jgi:hypothetical protein
MGKLPIMLADPDLPSQVSRRNRRSRWLSVSVLLSALVSIATVKALPRPVIAKQEQTVSATNATQGVRIINHAGYPELRVDGSPFFIHSATFFYYRIPRDQWQALLRIYRAAGINTIDLYIPWNWHEPKEGEFDFDGHSNPRRDLRALLAIIANEGFKLIARPGPEILNEWRHGGYPGWLLERPEYKMNRVDWIEGQYPPLDSLNARDAEAAAQGWLQNATHMSHAREWLTAVARELALYSPDHSASEMQDHSTTAMRGGKSLLFVQLGDDFAIGRTNHVGHDFWRYVESLRQAVEAGGVKVPVFINPTDMRVSATGSAEAHPVGVMGQWYQRVSDDASGDRHFLNGQDAGEIEFFVEELKTQPQFPPIMIEYQAGWYAPADDDRPTDTPRQNTLLSSRLMVANGVHGINYMPLQDTYSPAGYSVPWVNRSYRWNAALGPDGDAQPRLPGVARNSAMLHRWGSELAASHKRADFGIIYPLGAYPQEDLSRADILQVSESVMRIERLATLSMLATELLDPEYQPVEQLLHDAVVFLPVFDPDRPQFQLSERAQRTILEYVRRGGTLVVFPTRPAGTILEELWKSAPLAEPLAPEKGIRAQWKFGDGEVFESTKNFFSWVALDRSLSENRAQRESEWAKGVLHETIAASGLRPSVILSGRHTRSGDLIASEIVTNEGTGVLGERTSGQGFLSVTNLNHDSPAEAILEILSPDAPARGKHADYTALHITVPPHESLLLPLKAPVCIPDPGNTACSDAVEAAGAEFLEARREGKTLELQFYAPVRAEAHIRLAHRPVHVMIDDNPVESTWIPEVNELRVPLTRGPAPHYFRNLKIELPYKPNVPEAEKTGKAQLADLDFSVWNALRFPTSQGAFLRSYPPVITLHPNRPANVMLAIVNHSQNASRDIVATLDGPLHGSESYRIPARSSEVEWIRTKPSGKDAAPLTPGPDGFLHATIHIRSKNDQRDLPVLFLPLQQKGVTHYRYDFDRDGADEWVLENSALRMIVSPESGGQIVALVDKSSEATLSTSVGLLRDAFSFAENPEGMNQRRVRGRFGLSNRPYAPQWKSEQTDPALQLDYDAPDIFPAGAHIQKTIQMEGPGTIQVDYRVSLDATKEGSGPAKAQPQTFVILNSVPASAQTDHSTLFCWRADRAQSAKDAPGAANEGKENPHCEDFSPNGQPLRVPLDARWVEIHTAGHPATSIAWECADSCPQMSIEPKIFSALFRLQYPEIVPGGEAAQYKIRIRALNVH